MVNPHHATREIHGQRVRVTVCPPGAARAPRAKVEPWKRLKAPHHQAITGPAVLRQLRSQRYACFTCRKPLRDRQAVQIDPSLRKNLRNLSRLSAKHHERRRHKNLHRILDYEIEVQSKDPIAFVLDCRRCHRDLRTTSGPGLLQPPAASGGPRTRPLRPGLQPTGASR